LTEPTERPSASAVCCSEVLDNSQHHDRAPTRRQCGERLLQQVGVGNLVIAEVRRRFDAPFSRGMRSPHGQPPPGASYFVHNRPAHVAVGVANRALQPLPVRPCERFGHHILGERRIAGHCIDEPQSTGTLLLEHGCERAQIPALGDFSLDRGAAHHHIGQHGPSDAMDRGRVVRFAESS
jgi:hypothetical protein